MDIDYLSNPHDKFFKESFSHKEVVESFIQEYLPEAIHKQVDLNSLEILKDSYIAATGQKLYHFGRFENVLTTC